MFTPASDSDQNLLSEWRWLLGGLPRLVGWSTGGDLFIQQTDGSIALLDPGAGELQDVAESEDDFEDQLRDPERAAELLQAPIVNAFEARGVPLERGQCLSYTTLPVFGGGYTIENRYALSIHEHAGVTGEIHRQIRDLPDGAQIRLNTTS